MRFIHHTTGAAGATGLMAESAPPPWGVSLERLHLLATDLPVRPTSIARLGGRPLCNTDRAAALDASQSAREDTRPIPATRFRIAKGQEH